MCTHLRMEEEKIYLVDFWRCAKSLKGRFMKISFPACLPAAAAADDDFWEGQLVSSEVIDNSPKKLRLCFLHRGGEKKFELFICPIQDEPRNGYATKFNSNDSNIVDYGNVQMTGLKYPESRELDPYAVVVIDSSGDDNDSDDDEDERGGGGGEDDSDEDDTFNRITDCVVA